MNIFDIDDAVYCIFCAISDMQTMMSLLQVDQRWHRIYQQLTQKDIKNNIVRKYWRTNPNNARLIYNDVLTIDKLPYVDSRDMVMVLVLRLPNGYYQITIIVLYSCDNNIVSTNDLLVKVPGYKYIIKTDKMTDQADVPKIVLVNFQHYNSFRHLRSIITNELFSMIVDI